MWDIFDAIVMKVPVYNAASIRAVPFYIRWRVRMMHDILREVKMENARRGKALAVYDYAQD